jgi:hypothetical protein
MSDRFEHEIADPHANDFRHARPGVVERGEQDVIAVAAPGRAIGCREQRVYFRSREKSQQRPIEALRRNGERALDDRQDGRVANGCVVEEGAQRREACIAGPRAIVSRGLEVIEKRQQQWCVQVGQRDSRRRFVQSILCVGEQQSKRIAVAGHRARTRLSLSDQMLVKEVLQQRRERRGHGHERSPASANVSNRLAPIAISSGTAVRYQ